MESLYEDTVLRHLPFKKKSCNVFGRVKTTGIMYSFSQLKILRAHLLYIQETILFAKEKCNCAVNKQVLTYNTRNIDNYHRYVHNLELYNNKPSVAQIQCPAGKPDIFNLALIRALVVLEERAH